MFYHAKNGTINFGNTDMDYISFGNGTKNLILIPGLGDGLRTVKGLAVSFSMMYKKYAKNYKVFVFSRKNQLEQGYSTRDMARDIKAAADKLGITKAHVMGVSQGGMIAQYIAIDYQELVEKLVLVVTLSKQNETVQKVVKRWIKMAEDGDYKNLMIDTTEKSYTEEHIRRKRLRMIYPLLGRFGKPKDFKRFIIQANSCIQHNAYAELEKITCPTLIIGGDSDQVVGKNSSEEMSDKISKSTLMIYKGLGHMTYEEAKDFDLRVLEFLDNTGK